jgi:hypothetical protein
MTYTQEIELLLQTAERIDEEMQRSSSQQLLLILLEVVLVILMLFIDNTIWRIVILGPLLWAPYYQYQTYIKQKADAKTKFELADKADVILSKPRNPALELTILTKAVYAMRINRLKS